MTPWEQLAGAAHMWKPGDPLPFVASPSSSPPPALQPGNYSAVSSGPASGNQIIIGQLDQTILPIFSSNFASLSTYSVLGATQQCSPVAEVNIGAAAQNVWVAIAEIFQANILSYEEAVEVGLGSLDFSLNGQSVYSYPVAPRIGTLGDPLLPNVAAFGSISTIDITVYPSDVPRIQFNMPNLTFPTFVPTPVIGYPFRVRFPFDRVTYTVRATIGPRPPISSPGDFITYCAALAVFAN